MKFLFLLFSVLMLCSCQPSNEKQNIKTSSQNDISIMKLKKIMAGNSEFNSIFKEVSQTVLKANNNHTISNIKTIRVTEKNIIVADSHGKQLLVFNEDGKLENTVGKVGSGPGEFISPYDIAINTHGEIIVLDPSSSRVSTFKLDGTFIASNKVKLASRICEDLNGGFYLYNQTEIFESNNNVIFHYDKNGTFNNELCPVFWKFPIVGSNFTLDKEGNVYIIHASEYLIKKFSPDGDFVKDFGNIPNFYKPLEVPKDGSFASQDKLDEYTPLMKILITKSNLILVELVRSKPKARWIDIYDTSGNLLKNGMKIDTDLSLVAVGDDDTIYFIKYPSDEIPLNSVEVPDYQIVGYKIRNE